MHPSRLKPAIKAAIKARLSTFLWGPPGVGKSQLIQQIAKELGIGLIDLRLSQLDPADVRGIPSIDHEEHLSRWNAPEFLPRPGVHPDQGILFLDELNSAHPATQTVGYQLVLDHKVGDYELPPGWVTIGAGNRAEDKAIVNRMASALSNRFLHFDFEVFHEDWLDWAATSGDIIPEVSSFIRWKPTLLHQMDADERSFPTPRTWDFVSRIFPHTSQDIEFEVVSGLVGQGAATEFIAYNRIFRGLPDPQEIIKNPDSVKIDDQDPAVMHAISGSLAAYANEETFAPILKFADKMPPEYQTILTRDALGRNIELRHTEAFKKWTRKNASALL